jgi:hypothetical protein
MIRGIEFQRNAIVHVCACHQLHFLYDDEAVQTFISRRSSVRIAARARVVRNANFDMIPQLPDRLWGPPSLVSRGSFPWEKAAGT